nr:hypothetical protein [Tanacetum cinerariifolium]
KSSKINNGVANKESTDRGPIQITTKNSFSALSEETDTNLKDKECVNADGQTPIKSHLLMIVMRMLTSISLWRSLQRLIVTIRGQALSLKCFLMINVGAWNIRGMNLSPKQNEVRQHVFKNWSWISNAMSCLKGIRIIVGWNQNDVDVAVIHQDPQVIHTRIWIKADKKEFFCSFVYAFNKYINRRPLWNGLCLHKNYINNRPWCLLGDFNAPLCVEDTSMGSSSLDVTMHNRFKDVVRNAWMAHISGFFMFRVVKKLKGLKKHIRKLMYYKGNLHANVIRLREELDKVQTDLDSDSSNFSLREKEAMTVADFNEALLMEEKFLKQKAKITWLKEGDSNTAYFHKVVKSHVSRSRIDVVTDAYGNVHKSTEVAKAFIDHYEISLGQPGNTSDFNTDNLFLTTLDESEAFNMVHDISSQEDIIGVDVIKAVREFFTNGRLLKELNHTIITLIPKVNTPARVTDYRPISCCNVLFKCISKIIANRLKSSLKRLISPNQSSFVPGRCISDNILLTQEIMHNYHLDRRVPRSKVIKDTLDEFKDASGLNPSMPKSKAYFCNVINNTKLAILNILPFEEDRLLVKYLGVPLLSSRLISRDYNTSRGKVKVAWDVVCLPKQEGGLGVFMG